MTQVIDRLGRYVKRDEHNVRFSATQFQEEVRDAENSGDFVANLYLNEFGAMVIESILPILDDVLKEQDDIFAKKITASVEKGDFVPARDAMQRLGWDKL